MELRRRRRRARFVLTASRAAADVRRHRRRSREAFVASLSSCHLLWFLAIAAKRGYIVDSYADDASGVMEKNSAGQLAMTRITLRPLATFSGSKLPDRAALDALHHAAHEQCFIAASIRSEVVIEPRG